MPDATELCSLADCKTLLGLTTSAQEAVVTLVKNGVEAFVKNFCGRDFIVTTYTEYPEGDGGNSIRVRQYPITSITSIHIDASREFTAASLVPATDYITDPRMREIGWIDLYAYQFSRSRGANKIVYVAGHSTIPYDLSMAVKAIICKQYKVIDKKMFAEVSQSAGDMTITLSPDTFPKDAMEVLMRHRRIAF
jgi:hypothetical protein